MELRSIYINSYEYTNQIFQFLESVNENLVNLNQLSFGGYEYRFNLKYDEKLEMFNYSANYFKHMMNYYKFAVYKGKVKFRLNQYIMIHYCSCYPKDNVQIFVEELKSEYRDFEYFYKPYGPEGRHYYRNKCAP